MFPQFGRIKCSAIALRGTSPDPPQRGGRAQRHVWFICALSFLLLFVKGQLREGCVAAAQEQLSDLADDLSLLLLRQGADIAEHAVRAL